MLTASKTCSESGGRENNSAIGDLNEEINKALLLFEKCLANPKQVDEELVEIWEFALSAASVQPEQVRPASRELLLAQTFFPTPADFLKILAPKEDGDAASELAWQTVLTAIREHGGYASITAADLGGDEAALWAVGRMGWERLCAELEADNRAIFRAEFIRTYNAAKSSGERERYLPGRNERLNDANGRDLNPELVGRPDWPALPGTEAPKQPRALAPVCPECRSTRHLAWCPTLERKKALPAADGTGSGFTRLGAVIALPAPAVEEPEEVADAAR